jgi:hypothetical protein
MNDNLTDQQFHEITARLKANYLLVPKAWVIPLVVAGVIVFGSTGWSVLEGINATATQKTIQLAEGEAKKGADRVRKLCEVAEKDAKALGDLATISARIDGVQHQHDALKYVIGKLNCYQYHINRHVFAKANDGKKHEETIDGFKAISKENHLYQGE